MNDWLRRLSRGASGGPAPSRDVMRALRAATKGATTASLTSLDSGRDRSASVRLATLERRRLLVRGPAGPSALEPGELVRLEITTGNGRLVGRTRIRSAEPSGSGRTASVEYALVIPDELRSVSRSGGRRGVLGRDMTIEAELLEPGTAGEPVRGLLLSVELSGIALRSGNATGRLRVGERRYLRAQLPAPVGEITEMVRIDRVEQSASGTVVRARFDRRVERLDEAIRAANGIARLRGRAA